MVEYSDKAKEYFKQGYNCAQSVVAAYSDKMNIDFETALKLSSSFGGGMGRLREVCGAVSGMFLVAGMLFGYDSPLDNSAKMNHYALVQKMAAKFKEENGSIICRELLNNMGKESDNINNLPHTTQLSKKRACAEMVAQAAEILEEIIKNAETKQ